MAAAAAPNDRVLRRAAEALGGVSVVSTENMSRSSHRPSGTFRLSIEGAATRTTDVLSDATSEDLKSPGTPPPWCPQECSVLSCFRVVLNEEWWHHQFAIRDLAVLERRPREWRDQGV